MTQRIHESGTISVDKTTNALRVCLITEGEGSSAEFPRSFFVAENAKALSGVMSWPSHPEDLERPERRDPLSAIGSIGENITIEEHDGKLGFWGEYIPAKSKPQIAEYIREYGAKLGLSVYGDSDGHKRSDGKWVAESLDSGDEYRSVDLVVAAGRGGKFEKVSESLGLLPKAPATAVEKEDNLMEIKELADKVDRLTVIAENLVKVVEGKQNADLQVQADETAVNKAVESRLAEYDKAVGLISEAKLTESQSSDLRALALTGADIAPAVEKAKSVLAEALGLADKDDDADKDGKIAENHSGSSAKKGTFDPFAGAPGFGKVA